MGIMEFASRLRWFLVIVGVVLFMVLIGWGLFSIARSIFDSSSDSNNSNPASQQIIDEDVRLTSQASYYLDGRIVANSEHRSYRIDVSSNVVSMKVYSSYGQQIIRENTYRNTSEAYSSFIASLDNLGVEQRVRGTTTEDDYAEEGKCPGGFRYIVELDDTIRRWTTNCDDVAGTAGFNMNAVKSLFQRQVPDYEALIEDIDF